MNVRRIVIAKETTRPTHVFYNHYDHESYDKNVKKIKSCLNDKE